MKMKRSFFLAFFLLAMATAAFAQDLTVSPAGKVTVGTVLHFSMGAPYGEADCPLPTSERVISWYVACETGNGWKTESFRPAYGEGAAAWKTYSFTTTYTVTAADINNPNFCFTLYGRSGCWSFDHPYSATKKCPPTKFTIPPIHLQKYFNCKLVPGCPRCLKLDLQQLIDSLGDPVDQVQVVLLRNGQQVAVLGHAGRGRKLPGQVQITLPDDPLDKNLSRLRQVTGFQLQALGRNGQVLASEEVTLKIN